jgi:hypothetical protein
MCTGMKSNSLALFTELRYRVVHGKTVDMGPHRHMSPLHKYSGTTVLVLHYNVLTAL